MSRSGRWRGLWLAVALTIVGAGGFVPQASADGECVSAVRVFAVDSGTGRLAEIASCPDTPGLGSAVEVDSADWRGYSSVFAVRDGAAAILYAVTTGGELWWWRQENSGAPLSAPVRVAASITWSWSAFASRSGYLHTYDQMRVRTFRHLEWASGGATVAEEAPLFTAVDGPAIIGLTTAANSAVSVAIGMTFQVWRDAWSAPDSRWYRTGILPAGVNGVVGDERRLYAVGPTGEAVLLRKPSDAGSLRPTHSAEQWEVVATASGSYSRVVAPVPDGNAGPPHIGDLVEDSSCGGTPSNPWEWQNWW